MDKVLWKKTSSLVGTRFNQNAGPKMQQEGGNYHQRIKRRKKQRVNDNFSLNWEDNLYPNEKLSVSLKSKILFSRAKGANVQTQHFLWSET